MTAFRVWSPNSSQATLHVQDQQVPMTRAGEWWEAESEAVTGTQYRYSLDGGPKLPDPRSPWQPEGVHGPSAVVHHDEFPWTDGAWTGLPLASGVVYEMHVGTFTPKGTFDAAIGKLGHLASLGVNMVEVMPVASFPGARGWGYDGVALFAPHQPYGGPDGFKRFVDACHSHNIAVISDVVYNHLGPDGNYLGAFGPYFTDVYRTPWGQAVNFDGPHSDEVRSFFVDNALMWIRDYHVDGLRLDAVHAIVDTSATHILEQITAAVHRLGAHLERNSFVIAESNANDPRLVKPPEAGGYGLDASWSDDLHHALHSTLTGEHDGYYIDFAGAGVLPKAMQDVFVNDGSYSPFRQRRFGRSAGGISRYRFLGYMQNHDQVGNRAQGERISALMSVGRCKIAAAFVLLGPFVPMLFQGEEWGARTPFLYFTDHEDPDLAKAVSEGRKHEFVSFGWEGEVPDPQLEETFRRSVLDWNEPNAGQHADLLDWHRQLIVLRHSDPVFTDGASAHCRRSGDVITMVRGRYRVTANIGTAPSTEEVGSPCHLLVGCGEGTALLGNTLTVAPDGVAVSYMSGGGVG